MPDSSKGLYPALAFKARIRGQLDSSSSPSFHRITNRGPVELNSDNSWTHKVTAECLWSDLFRYMPVRNATASPDFPQLLCDSASATYKAPGTAVLVITFRGLPGFELPPGDEEMIVSTSEQPIATHPRFVTEIAGKPSAVIAGSGAIFTGTNDATDTFVEFSATSPYRGVESYLAPTVTFRNNYASYSRPDISRVGFIWSPTNAPGAGGSRNWLCTGVTWRRYGGYYSINEDSLLSGAAGWNQVVYRS